MNKPGPKKGDGKQPKKSLHGAAARSAAGEKLGGRPKGVPNRVTTALKETILKSLEQAGGPDYLARQADENPAAYMQLLGKVVPQDVNATIQQLPVTPEQADRVINGD
jgi:hypothetical protein